ncbi:MAG: FAD-dependent thymidylate synthase [Thermoprotei archaeon]
MIRLLDQKFSVAGATFGVHMDSTVEDGAPKKRLPFELEVGPQLFSALCAAGTHSQSSIYEILESKVERFLAQNPGCGKQELASYLEGYASKVFDNTLAHGHIDVADMGSYLVVGENVPRLCTLFWCSPHHLNHEQQSLRYTQANSFHLPRTVRSSRFMKRAEEVLLNCYDAYREFISQGVLPEDARSVLPLAVNSNITTIGGGREYTYVSALIRSRSLLLPSVVRDSVEQVSKALSEISPEVFKDRGPNYELRRYFPGPQLFARENRFVRDAVGKHGANKVTLLSFSDPGLCLDRETVRRKLEEQDPSFLVNLLHIRAVFLIRFSLEAAHQAIRHRTWNHDFEPIYVAADRFEYMTPPSIEQNGLKEAYDSAINRLYTLYEDVKNELGPEEAVIFLPNSHLIYDVVEIDGWNMVGNLPLRTCEKAQWEIRGVAKAMVSKIAWGSPASGFRGDKTLSYYALPPCQTFNVCFEDNTRDVCPIYRHKYLKAEPAQPKLIS